MTTQNVSTKHDNRSDGFTYAFRVTFFTGFGLIAFYALINIAITVWSVLGHTNSSVLADANSMEAMGFAARLIQVSMGMMMGFFTVFLGMLAAWMGIEGRYKLSGHTEGYGLTLASASPGILLIVCGTFLVSVCLLKPMNFRTERIDVDAGQQVTKAGSAEGAPTPQPSKK